MRGSQEGYVPAQHVDRNALEGLAGHARPEQWLEKRRAHKLVAEAAGQLARQVEAAACQNGECKVGRVRPKYLEVELEGTACERVELDAVARRLHDGSRSVSGSGQRGGEVRRLDEAVSIDEKLVDLRDAHRRRGVLEARVLAAVPHVVYELQLRRRHRGR